MLINIPEARIFPLIGNLKYHHRITNCGYCGDNLDGSETECSLMYLIKLLERKYKQMKEAS